MSSEISELVFINLSDNVLLHVFKYLNWIDTINVVATCTRMKNVKYWLKKQLHEFDFQKYVEKASVPLEKLLPVIGPYIRIARITENVLSKSILDKCCSIKSLRIDECSSRSAAILFNTWLKILEIESLYVDDGFLDVEELLNGLCGLKKFVFDSHQKLPSNFFYNNSEIQHLLLILEDDYDLSSLQVLHSLQSLFIYIKGIVVLEAVQKYVKMDNLKEFSIHYLDDNWDADTWNNFANYLAKNTELDNLQLGGYIFTDKPSVYSLKMFNLTSLRLEVDLSWIDFSTILHESTAPRLKYLRLQWPLSWCCSEKIGYILKKWTTIEVICLDAGPGDYPTHQLHFSFNDIFFREMLNISDERPKLRLHIFSSEISFNFISKYYHVIEGRKCCACKESFQLWDGANCNFSL